MVLLAPDVAQQVDAAESAPDQADRQLAELKGEDRGHCEDDPDDRHGVTGRPEGERVHFVGLTCLSEGLEVPLLLSCVIDFAPPAQAHQDSVNKEKQSVC